MKTLIVGHSECSILELIQIEKAKRDQIECIPIESTPKKSEESWLGHSFDIIPSEPITFEEIYPEPKKGIGQKAQWANKPHKRKRK